MCCCCFLFTCYSAVTGEHLDYCVVGLVLIVAEPIHKTTLELLPQIHTTFLI